MKTRYAFHPQEFLLGETEKFYADRAAAGWALTKRGAYLSRFARTEPAAMGYRLEVASPKMPDGGQLPKEQITVYEDCGWEYVTGHGLIHVFRAPEGSSAPEFYLEPAQHAATLKSLRRQYISSLLWALLYPAFLLLLTLLMFGADDVLKRFANLYITWVRGAELILFLLLVLLLCSLNSIRAVLHLSRLHRRMKQGIPLDHEPKGRNHIFAVLRAALAVSSAVLLLIGLSGHRSGSLPEASDGPYLLFSDAGYAGERVGSSVNGRESTLERSTSMLAKVWDCYEIINTADGEELWMYQDVYELQHDSMTDRLVTVLMYSATFADAPENYTAVEVEGLDQAWVTNRLECIAVKGRRVCMMTVPFYTREELVSILHAISDHWADA